MILSMKLLEDEEIMAALVVFEKSFCEHVMH